MKTLIINCYRELPDKKIKNYCELIDNFSSHEVVYDKDVKKNFKVNDYNAVIISGSEDYISKGKYFKDFLKFLKSIKIPVLGICYGHQIIAKAFGVGIIHGLKKIIKPYPKNPEEVFILNKDEIFHGLDNNISVYESHIEYVNPEYLSKFGFKLLANSKSCPVETIKHLDKSLYGVQFHIERSGETGKKIVRNFFEFVVRKFINI
ncbi:Imidazole glycerol phosphate synthase subunit HisH [subsurface metagenome]